MLNKIISFAVSIIISLNISIAQDLTKCKVFENLIPNNLNGDWFAQLDKLTKGDTIYLNMDFMNKFKIEKYLINTLVYYREPTNKERSIMETIFLRLGNEPFIINKEEMLVADSFKIYKLKIDTVYNYQYNYSWFKITPEKAISDIRKYGQISIPKIFESSVLHTIQSRKDAMSYLYPRVKLSHILDKNYSILDLPKLKNEKLIVSWINTKSNCGVLNGHGTKILLRTLDKREYYVHSVLSPLYEYAEYPIFQKEENLELIKRRQEFNANLSKEIKEIKFTYYHKSSYYFNLINIYFTTNEIFYIASRYDEDNKFLEIDTIKKTDDIIFYNYDCYHQTTEAYSKAKKLEYENYLRKNFTTKEIEYIKNKQIFIGMSEKALIESLDYPKGGINDYVSKGYISKQYVYGLGQYVYVLNGFIISWENFH